MKKNNSVSYIFPVHNESEFLEKQIDAFLEQIKKYRLPITDIILVENGSSDNSWQICKKLAKKNKKIIAKRISIGSYGLAVKHGLLCSQSDTLVLLNVDFFDVKFIHKALFLPQPYEVVNGSKLHPESNDTRDILDKLRTKSFNFFLNHFFKYSGTDTHGIKVFKNTKKLQQAINATVTKHELFDTELLYRMIGSVTELPITIHELRPTRYSGINRAKRTLIDVVRLLSYLLFSKKTIPKNLLRIADDYGINPIISRAIVDLYESKQIDVISVLPNMVTESELLTLKQRVKNSRIAVHLNLVRGKPVTNPNQISSLVTKKREFYSLPKFLLRLILRKINLSEVKTELQNQIESLNKIGIRPNYINSEQHTHVLAPIYNIVAKLAKKNKIRYIRNTCDITNYLSWRIHKRIIFIMITFILELLYSSVVSKNRVVKEIICHPGSNYD